MSTRCHLPSFRVCLCLLVVATLSGCTSRKVVTAIEDQHHVPGPTAQVQAPMTDTQVSQPIPPKPPAPVQIEKPASPPAVGGAGVTERPIAPAAPSQPPAKPTPEFTDVFFDFDRSVIRHEAQAGLEANAGLLQSPSVEKILIEGHCDERGTSAYNLVLGERRARAAAQYLRDLGVPSSQIQITSYGKERPFCEEHSEACWQSNRRAHFTR